MITNQDDLVVGIIGSYSIENELRDRGETWTFTILSDIRTEIGVG
jgi:hypothetical protein